MSSECLVLKGIEGLVKGEEYNIELGETVVIGRSSKCDICLKYLYEDEEQKNPGGKQFNTVSREHIRISFHNLTTIEFEDLSSNGTYIDGKQITSHIISDAIVKNHQLQLGAKEKFLVMLEKN
ncbi:MAG: FHA domain-containing protein [Planctomycetota bacterium]